MSEESLYEIMEQILAQFPAALDFTDGSPEATPEIVDTLTKVAVCVNNWPSTISAVARGQHAAMTWLLR